MTFSRLFSILKHIAIVTLFPLSLQATPSTIETYDDFQKIFPGFGRFIQSISVSDQEAHIKGKLLREKVKEAIENGIAEKKAKLIERFDIILKQFTAKNFLESHNDTEICYAQKASPYVMELRCQFHKLSPGSLLFVNTDLPNIEDWFIMLIRNINFLKCI